MSTLVKIVLGFAACSILTSAGVLALFKGAAIARGRRWQG